MLSARPSLLACTCRDIYIDVGRQGQKGEDLKNLMLFVWHISLLLACTCTQTKGQGSGTARMTKKRKLDVACAVLAVHRTAHKLALGMALALGRHLQIHREAGGSRVPT